MRRSAGIDVGDVALIKIEFDPEPRIVPMHPILRRTLLKGKEAKTVFEKLSPSRQKEVLRYLSFLKTEASAKRMKTLPTAFVEVLQPATQSFVAF